MSTSKSHSKKKLRCGSASEDNTMVITRNALQNQIKSSASAESVDDVGVIPERIIRQLEARLMTGINDLFTQLEARILTKIENSISALTERVACCEASLSKIQENNVAQTVQVENLSRIQRLNDVVIRGIPVYPQEKLPEIVKEISTLIKHPITPFVDAFRIASKKHGQSSPIIVRFSCHSEQRNFLLAFRSCGGVKLCQLNGFTSTSPISANESLTPRNSSLFREAIKLRRAGKISSVRTINGFVFTRTTGDNSFVKVTDLEQLLNIK